MPLLSPEQVERMNRKREAQVAAPAAPPAQAAAPPSTPPPAAPADTRTPGSYRATPSQLDALLLLGQQMTDARMVSSVDLADACLAMAALTLTNPLAPPITRERFVELAAAAFDNADTIPLDQRAKPEAPR